MRLGTRLAAVALAALAVFGLWAHQARTQDQKGGKVLPVLSTTDVIGYTSPCG